MSHFPAPRRLDARVAFATSLLAFSLCAVSTPATAQVRTADPGARGIPLTAFPRFVKLADRVYGYEEIRAPGMTTVSLVVLGTNGVLIADGQGSPAATQTMVNKIKELTPLPIKWYVVGSDHGDHTAGNSVLPQGIRYIVSPASLAQLKKDSAAATPGRVVVVPTAAMTGNEETIDVGGTTVKALFLGRAHTGGDLMVLLPREKILFMSEVYLNRVFPAMRSAYPSEWVKTIDAALALKGVDRFIPGHGFIEENKVSREELVTFRDAVTSVIAEVKRQKTLGVTVDAAITQANWGPLAQWFLADQQGAIAVRRVWLELDGTLK
jgi:glyoxylase-like metal-dependent hydrolase (beta-lactamase superfamily II)